jgi:hypothetical protein
VHAFVLPTFKNIIPSRTANSSSAPLDAEKQAARRIKVKDTLHLHRIHIAI